MPNGTPTIRVVVRLPYNRPENAPPDPPRVEWNPEKEQILWEVIAKSRAVEGAGTDWKGLAAHLQVPLPYLLFRAQTRYEEDLRGLQGIRGALSPTITSPTIQIPLTSPNGVNDPSASGSKPASATGEYFHKLASPVPDAVRKNFPRVGVPNGTIASSVTTRPLNVRARLNSLSHSSRVRKLSMASQSPRQVMGSSVLTLQGPRKSREHAQRLSPTTSSRASPSRSSNDASSEEENEKAEEELRRAEEQAALDNKLKNLQRIMTREALGLVASTVPLSPTRSQFQPNKGKEVDRGRMRPLSASIASLNADLRLDPTRRHSTSQTPSHHSLSSASSPQGSIPSIPSPPPERRNGDRPESPMARRFSDQFKSTSPPAVSTRSAWAHANARHGMVNRTKVGGRSERGSEVGSEVSSFSDLSDASLSASALESALMSNMRGGSRLAFPGRRGSVR